MSYKKKSRLSFYLFICITAISLFLFTGCPDPIVAPTVEGNGYFDVSLILVGSEDGVPYTKEVHFSESVNSVSVEVGNGLETVDVELLDEVSGADIKVNNRSLDMSSKVSVSLDTGSNEISVKVSPGSVDPFYYTLVIKRQLPNGEAFSSDATLSSLEISSVSNSVITPVFSPDVFGYTSTLNYNVAAVNLTATSSDDNSKIEINGVEIESGAESELITVAEGQNEPIEIIVTAEDEITVNTYSLVIFKLSEKDETSPIITLVNGTPVYLEVFSAWQEPGYSAYDAAEGDLTSAVTVSGSVDTSTVGFGGSFTYTVSDTSGNAASETRHIYIEDNTAPVLELNGSNPMRVDKGSGNFEDQDPGASAVDNYDGDISGSIIVSGDVVDTAVEDTYQVIYTSTDSNGNSTSVTRIVVVSNDNDTDPPDITLLGANPYQHEVNTPWSEPGFTALDAFDGNLAASVSISGSVNTSVLGSSTLYYDVSDSSGNAAEQKSRVVNVVDTTKPDITLIGAGEITVAHGNVYSDPGVIVTDNYDTGLTAVVSGTVSVNTVGTYFLKYDAADSSGNEADPQLRTVHVTDQTPPLITLNGSSEVTVPLGGTFTEPWAAGNVTASDNVDGDITAKIVVSGDTVDPGTTGVYHIYYDVTDFAGHEADRVTLTVTVSDETPPVLTLNGASTITLEITDTYSEPGWTVSDNLDTNVEVTVSGSVVNGVEGIYTLTYTAEDDYGNTTVRTRQVTVSPDAEAPVLTLLGEASMILEVYETYSESGWTVTDNFDTNVDVTVSGTVQNGVAGTYTLTYTAEDDYGNTAVRTRQVVVNPDAEVPVITLNGAAEITLDYGEPFSDPGADVTDNWDPDTTVYSPVTVDTESAGEYILTYDYTDAGGNSAVQVTRTVTVLAPVDTTPPVIYLYGDATVTLEYEEDLSYTDPGAFATDVVITGEPPVNVTDDIIVTDDINYELLGTYHINYSVTDQGGNNTTVSRAVIIEDTTGPVITIDGDNPLTIDYGSSFSVPDAEAADLYDGTLDSDDFIITGSGAVNTSVLHGSYAVEYSISDSEGNTSTAELTVNIEDLSSPVISITGDNTVTVECGSIYTDAGATATDNYDTSLTVSSTSDVNDDSPGTYTVDYNVTDSNGNIAATVSRTVNVVDTTDPVITLFDGAVVVEVGSDWSLQDPGYQITDNNPATLSLEPVLSGLDMNTVGVQTLRYNLTDPSGNHADEVTRTVTVEDNVAPVITVGGSNPMTVDYGTVFTDGEVTASDNYEGDVSGSIIVSGDTVNTSIIGDYVILYNVSDLSGNNAVQRSRTVYVRDLSAPVMTLNGDNPVTIECLTAYADAGATASDVHDGDLTASIVTTGGTIDTSFPDTHTVSYQVEDAAGNSTTETRTVNVVDTTIPVITLTAPTTLSVEVNSLWSDPGFSASDTVDGDITADVVRSGPNMSILGTQTVSYDVSDLSGNEAVTVTRSVTTQDTTAPVITLNAGYGGTDEIRININIEFSDPGATVYDNYDNYGSSWTIYGSGFVDTSIAGTYTLTYNSTDTHSNSAVPVIRTVIVQ